MKNKDIIESLDTINLSDEAKNRIYKNITSQKTNNNSNKAFNKISLKYAIATFTILFVFCVTTFSNKTNSFIANILNFNNSYENNVKSILTEVSDGTYTLKITELFQTKSEILLYVTIETDEIIDLFKNKFKVFSEDSTRILASFKEYDDLYNPTLQNYVIIIPKGSFSLNNIVLTFLGKEELKLTLPKCNENLKDLSLQSKITYDDLEINKIYLAENALFFDIIFNNVDSSKIKKLYNDIMHLNIHLIDKNNKITKIITEHQLVINRIFKYGNEDCSFYTFKYKLEELVNLDDIVAVSINDEIYNFE